MLTVNNIISSCDVRSISIAMYDLNFIRILQDNNLIDTTRLAAAVAAAAAAAAVVVAVVVV